MRTLFFISWVYLKTHFSLFLSNTYRQKFKEKGHEARLYSSMFAGVLFPISMFIYAWTSLPNVSWVGSAVGIVVRDTPS